MGIRIKIFLISFIIAYSYSLAFAQIESFHNNEVRFKYPQVSSIYEAELCILLGQYLIHEPDWRLKYYSENFESLNFAVILLIEEDIRGLVKNDSVFNFERELDDSRDYVIYYDLIDDKNREKFKQSIQVIDSLFSLNTYLKKDVNIQTDFQNQSEAIFDFFTNYFSFSVFNRIKFLEENSKAIPLILLELIIRDLETLLGYNFYVENILLGKSMDEESLKYSLKYWYDKMK